MSSRIYGGIDFTQLEPLAASDNQTTVLLVELGYLGLSDQGQADFQLQAQIGYISSESGGAIGDRVWGYLYNFTGESSDWSPVQTVTLSGSSNVTSSLSPTPKTSALPFPTNSTINSTTTVTINLLQFTDAQFLMVTVIVVVLIVASAIVLIYRKKSNYPPPPTNNG